MTRPLRACLGVLLATVIAAAGLSLITPSGAQPPPSSISFDLDGTPLEIGSMEVVATLSAPCDTMPDANDVTFEFRGLATTAPTVTAVSTSQFMITIPGSLRSMDGNDDAVGVLVTCPVAAEPVEFVGLLRWAQVNFTKTVIGTAPADASFTVHGVCSFSTSSATPEPEVSLMALEPAVLSPMEFSLDVAEGETVPLLLGAYAVCEFTETQDHGATSAVIDPASLVVDQPHVYAVEVTNTFPYSTPRYTG